MADDPNKRGYQDRDRVNVNEKYEVEYWSQKWGVTAEALKTCAEKVGPMVKDIEKCLSK